MRILTFKRIVGLAAIGGVVYVHKQRGGDWSLASMRDTALHLLRVAADKLQQMNEATQRAYDRAADITAANVRTRMPDSDMPKMYGDLRRNEPGQ